MSSVEKNKFHAGNGEDGKHYWLTPPELLNKLNDEFGFDHDPCPYPKPDDYDGLTSKWGLSNYVNPPFGSIMHQGPHDKNPKKKGPTAWARKCIEEKEKGNKSVMVFPLDKWVLMMIEHCSEIRNLGDVKWLATEDNSQGKGLGRHIGMFILDPKAKTRKELEKENAELKARLAHVENELKLEQEVVEFYGELDNWNTSYDDFAIDSDYEPFEVDDDGDSIYFGGKRARQRIKERKEFK